MFFDCFTFEEVWSKNFGWLSFRYSMYNIHWIQLNQFIGLGMGCKCKGERLYIIWLASIWPMWKARNHMLFLYEVIKDGQILYLFKFISGHESSLEYIVLPMIFINCAYIFSMFMCCRYYMWYIRSFNFFFCQIWRHLM